jgi:Zn-dependent protease with chaperone function
MKIIRVVAIATGLTCGASLLCAEQNPSSSDAQSPSAAAATLPSHSSAPITEYRLPPELHEKAHQRNRIHFRLNLIGTAYGVVVLWLILRWKLAPRFRNWSEQLSSRSFVHSLVFSPLLFLTIALLTLPLDIYGEAVEKQYGISVQGWGSWGWDWTKELLISLVIVTILVWLLYLVIRRSPRRWWLYFWLISLPIAASLVFLEPLVIDPLFHRFEPLQQKDPALVASLEAMLQRVGQNIPPERMFWMGASEKTVGLNAYVTGIGSSKRLVVWDTTLAKLNTSQIVFVAGHETGHYVLKHIPKGMVFFALLLLIAFYVGYRTVGWVLTRYGPGWKIRDLQDWASLPVLLLLLSIFTFVVSPIGAAYSRHLEHQADQFGLEVTHGLIPDSGQVAARDFQIMGEIGLADPDPNPLDVFLFYDHPPISSRVRFCVTYDPWAGEGQGEFVK